MDFRISALSCIQVIPRITEFLLLHFHLTANECSPRMLFEALQRYVDPSFHMSGQPAAIYMHVCGSRNCGSNSLVKFFGSDSLESIGNVLPLIQACARESWRSPAAAAGGSLFCRGGRLMAPAAASNQQRRRIPGPCLCCAHPGPGPSPWHWHFRDLRFYSSGPRVCARHCATISVGKSQTDVPVQLRNCRESLTAMRKRHMREGPWLWLAY